jgi:hypothetical protein
MVGIRQFRVLTVTTSLVRVQTMVAAVQGLTGGARSNVFLFAAAEPSKSAARSNSNLISGKGEWVRLVD